MQEAEKVAIVNLNDYITCKLCRGYFVDATTIIECLHTFCRSCIVKYLETNKYCPICDVQVHKTKPLLNIRPDKTLQDVVYKLVPRLYQSESLRRKNFYDSHPEAKPSAVEESGEATYEHILAPEESLCLTLNYHGSTEMPRYLRCPAAVSVFHLQKLLRAKYDLSEHHHVEIMYNQDCLNPNFTLMDVAYIYLWKRKNSLDLTYRIYEINAKKPKLEDNPNDYPKDNLQITQQQLQRQQQNNQPDNFSNNNNVSNNLNSNNSNWKEVQLRISESGEMSIIQDDNNSSLLDMLEKNEKNDVGVVENSSPVTKNLSAAEKDSENYSIDSKNSESETQNKIGQKHEKKELGPGNSSSVTQKSSFDNSKTPKNDVVTLPSSTTKVESPVTNVFKNVTASEVPEKDTVENKTEISTTEIENLTTPNTFQAEGKSNKPNQKTSKVLTTESAPAATNNQTTVAKKELPGLKFIGKTSTSDTVSTYASKKSLKLNSTNPLNAQQTKLPSTTSDLKAVLTLVGTTSCHGNENVINDVMSSVVHMTSTASASLTCGITTMVFSTINETKCSTKTSDDVLPHKIAAKVEKGLKRKAEDDDKSDDVVPPTKMPKQTILNHSIGLLNLSNNHPLKKHSTKFLNNRNGGENVQHQKQTQKLLISRSCGGVKMAQSHLNVTNITTVTDVNVLNKSLQLSSSNTSGSGNGNSRPGTPLALKITGGPNKFSAGTNTPCYMPKTNYNPVISVPRLVTNSGNLKGSVGNTVGSNESSAMNASITTLSSTTTRTTPTLTPHTTQPTTNVTSVSIQQSLNQKFQQKHPTPANQQQAQSQSQLSRHSQSQKNQSPKSQQSQSCQQKSQSQINQQSSQSSQQSQLSQNQVPVSQQKNQQSQSSGMVNQQQFHSQSEKSQPIQPQSQSNQHPQSQSQKNQQSQPQSQPNQPQSQHNQPLSQQNQSQSQLNQQQSQQHQPQSQLNQPQSQSTNQSQSQQNQQQGDFQSQKSQQIAQQPQSQAGQHQQSIMTSSKSAQQQPSSNSKPPSIKTKPSTPIGYKTLRDPPKSWNSQISKANLNKAAPNNAKYSDLKSVRPAKFFKGRNNMPRYLGNPASGVKPMYQVHVSPEKSQNHDNGNTNNVKIEKSEIKKHSIVKIDPKTLKPISEKAPEMSNLSNVTSSLCLNNQNNHELRLNSQELKLNTNVTGDLKINTSSVSIFNPLKLQSSPKSERRSPKSPHSPKVKTTLNCTNSGNATTTSFLSAPVTSSAPPAHSLKRPDKAVNQLNFTPPNPFVPNLGSPTLNPNPFLYPHAPAGFPSYDPRVMAAYHSLWYGRGMAAMGEAMAGVGGPMGGVLGVGGFDMAAAVAAAATASKGALSPKMMAAAGGGVQGQHSPGVSPKQHTTQINIPLSQIVTTRTQNIQLLSKSPNSRKHRPDQSSKSEKSLENTVEKLTQSKAKELGLLNHKMIGKNTSSTTKVTYKNQEKDVRNVKHATSDVKKSSSACVDDVTKQMTTTTATTTTTTANNNVSSRMNQGSGGKTVTNDSRTKDISSAQVQTATNEGSNCQNRLLDVSGSPKSEVKHGECGKNSDESSSRVGNVTCINDLRKTNSDSDTSGVKEKKVAERVKNDEVLAKNDVISKNDVMVKNDVSLGNKDVEKTDKTSGSIKSKSSSSDLDSVSKKSSCTDSAGEGGSKSDGGGAGGGKEMTVKEKEGKAATS